MVEMSTKVLMPFQFVFQFQFDDKWKKLEMELEEGRNQNQTSNLKHETSNLSLLCCVLRKKNF